MDFKERKIKDKIIKAFIHNAMRLLTFVVKRNSNIWMFGAWRGELYSGNSKYFFEFVTNNYSTIKAIWITNSKKDYEELKKSNKNVVLKNSIKAIFYSLRAKVFVVNISSDDIFNFVKHGVLFINLWHGVPIKSLLGDKRDDINFSKWRKIERRLVSFLTKDKIKGDENSLIVATSESAKINLEKSFNSKNVVVTGQPRDDIFYSDFSKEQILSKLKLEIEPQKKIVSYFPTFRDEISEYKSPFLENKIEMENFMKNNPDIIFLEKSHLNESISAGKIKNRINGYKNISNLKIDTQELLLITDILVTDYSSVYIDFLHLDRPTIFYAYDYESYYNTRGFLYDYEEIVSSKIVSAFDELLEAVQIYLGDSQKDKEKRERVHSLFHKYKDGNNSKRV